MKLSEAQNILREAGIEDSKREACEIFTAIGGISRVNAMLGDVETENPDVLSAVARRAKREPLQYIIGKVFFYNEEYEVDENVLIPRSDTEILVEYACGHLPPCANFLDLCTGSGCVGISTLKNTKNTTAVLADISENALSVARKNAERNGVSKRARFVISDAISESIEDSFYAVLSNPPYVNDDVYPKLESEIFYEPKIAFVGGSDGCDFYRSITEKYRNKIDKNGFIAYEIGYDQADRLRKIAADNAMTCEILTDYSGNDRVAVLKRLS